MRTPSDWRPVRALPSQAPPSARGKAGRRHLSEFLASLRRASPHGPARRLQRGRRRPKPHWGREPNPVGPRGDKCVNRERPLPKGIRVRVVMCDFQSRGACATNVVGGSGIRVCGRKIRVHVGYLKTYINSLYEEKLVILRIHANIFI